MHGNHNFSHRRALAFTIPRWPSWAMSTIRSCSKAGTTRRSDFNSTMSVQANRRDGSKRDSSDSDAPHGALCQQPDFITDMTAWSTGPSAVADSTSDVAAFRTAFLAMKEMCSSDSTSKLWDSKSSTGCLEAYSARFEASGWYSTVNRYCCSSMCQRSILADGLEVGFLSRASRGWWSAMTLNSSP